MALVAVLLALEDRRTNVCIVIADPWSERVPVGGAVNGHHLMVLADTVPTEDGGHRAVPLWLRVRGAKGELVRLLHPPAGDPLPIDGHWQETAARLLQAAGVAVTARYRIDFCVPGGPCD